MEEKGEIANVTYPKKEIPNVGHWKEEKGHVEITINAENDVKLETENNNLKIVVSKQQGANPSSQTGEIADVGHWKKASEYVEITINAGNDIKLEIEENKNLKIVVSKVVKPPSRDPPPQNGHGNNEGSNNNTQTDKKTDPPAQKESQVDNSSQQKKGSNDGEGNKRSDNVLGNVMNLLKDYKGIVITAVIAISLGFLLRRKFKVV